MGDDPLVLFEENEVDLFTLEVTAQNDLELVARAKLFKQLHLRSRGIGRGDDIAAEKTTVTLSPEKVFIQVKDSPSTRGSVTDNSVTSMTWQTKGGDVDSGVEVRENIDDILDQGEDNQGVSTVWSNGKDKLTAAGIDGGSKPGTLRIFITDGSFKLADADNSGFTSTPYDFGGSLGIVTGAVVLHFGELGTYKVGRAYKGTHNTAGEKTTDEETYIFHVGPIAELEVRDGGASPHAPADRSALTIFAANNGPDSSLGARVTKLPKGAEVLHISQGSYDGTAGEWDIGEMEDSDYLRATGHPEHVTLVLDATAGASANVKIENSAAYTVCIGSDASTLAHTTEAACEAVTGASWHEGTVYDYDDSNNSADITAARGTGGVGPGIPANPRTQTGTTAVMWDEVESLYGLPVERYEVQWLGNGWTSLDRMVAENQHVDAAPSGRRDYRVRAVNMAGVAGPWSRSTGQTAAGLAGPPFNLWTEADGNNAIDVFWDAPNDVGGSAITGYTVQWSLDGTGNWNNAGSTADQTFKHRGLQVGAIRYYRAAARNRSGLGLWSDPVMGQSESGTPDAPTLTAKTLSDYQIELTWNEPKDNGEPITGYQIEYSADGSADSWQALVAPGAGDTTYTDATLPANTRRHYRARAVNSVGAGEWSRAVSAITQLTPPDAPSLTSVEADGPNAIVVTWAEPYYLGDLPITQYQVQWAKDYNSETWRGPTTLSGSTLSWRHTGLKPDETWYYQVRASNGGGRWSVWSYTMSGTTASDNAPKVVSGLSAQYDKESAQVNLTWNDLAGDETTVQYRLERSEDGSDWRHLATVESSDSTSCAEGKCAYSDGDLWPGAKFYYRVRGAIDGEAGPWSGAKSVSVPPDPPDAPRMGWIEGDGSNHIYIDWEPPYYDGGAAITGYGLLWCRALDGADENPCDIVPNEDNPLADPPGYSRISLGASTQSYTHSVSPGYYYHYLLRATNGGNRWSEWREYDIYYARTYAGVPAAPGLTAQAVDANQIKLTWTKPNSYGSEISEYWLYVYQDGDELHDWDNILDILRVPGDRNEWTIGELDPGTTRYFRVRALNDNGEGKYSALRQATTPDN